MVWMHRYQIKKQIGSRIVELSNRTKTISSSEQGETVRRSRKNQKDAIILKQPIIWNDFRPSHTQAIENSLMNYEL